MKINPNFDRTKAIEAAKKLYRTVGKDENEIDKMRSVKVNRELYFILYPNVKSNGLCNELDTLGIPLIRVDSNYNAFIVDDEG